MMIFDEEMYLGLFRSNGMENEEYIRCISHGEISILAIECTAQMPGH
jgi:hypothetical protein